MSSVRENHGLAHAHRRDRISLGHLGLASGSEQGPHVERCHLTSHQAPQGQAVPIVGAASPAPVFPSTPSFLLDPNSCLLVSSWHLGRLSDTASSVPQVLVTHPSPCKPIHYMSFSWAAERKGMFLKWLGRSQVILQGEEGRRGGGGTRGLVVT